MQVEVVKATIEQKPLLANLLELYTYDFTEFCDFDIGDAGFYGYERLPLYWTESTRFPYLIYVNKKIAGFILVQKGSPISDDTSVWDIAEFFVMKRYKRHGIGTAAALKVWEQFKGPWQVRVLVENNIACQFWLQAIQKFIGEIPAKTKANIKGEDWVIYSFKSKDITAKNSSDCEKIIQRNTTYKIIVDHCPSQADNDVLREGLITWYEHEMNETRNKEFSVFLKNDFGKIVGGIQAQFDTEAVYLEALWIDEKLRKQGFGTKLIHAAEQEGIKNGCIFSILDTWDFQAEGFYVKNGYERIGEIKKYWREHSRIFLRKTL